MAEDEKNRDRNQAEEKDHINGTDEPYFERQKWEMCLLHALNALYQEQKFTSKDMDQICKSLAPNKMVNPHKSIFKTGNYDANVLMYALQNEGVEVQWFDSRKANDELNLNDESFLCRGNKKEYEFLGFILNNPFKKMLVFNRRHWLTIKRIDNVWFNLDSKQKKPTKYTSTEEIQELQDWLITSLLYNDAQLMICREERVQG